MSAIPGRSNAIGADANVVSLNEVIVRAVIELNAIFAATYHVTLGGVRATNESAARVHSSYFNPPEESSARKNAVTIRAYTNEVALDDISAGEIADSGDVNIIENISGNDIALSGRCSANHIVTTGIDENAGAQRSNQAERGIGISRSRSGAGRVSADKISSDCDA